MNGPPRFRLISKTVLAVCLRMAFGATERKGVRVQLRVGLHQRTRLGIGELDEPAERVREADLRDRATVHLEKPRTRDEVRQAARAGDRDVQAVAREQELDPARNVLAARA